MIIAIHQPNYLPYAGFFQKLARCDRFVLLDDAQYTRNGFINRNRIKTPTGPQWLTIPVHVRGLESRIRDVAVDPEAIWVAKHRKTLRANYARAPFFDEVMRAVIDPVLGEAGPHWHDLAALNAELIRRICAYVGLATPLVRASEYGVTTVSTQRLVELVRAAGGDAYLSGEGGPRYQDPAVFRAAGIHLIRLSCEPPVYPQLWGPFVPRLSVIDLLFNAGAEAGRWLRSPARTQAIPAPASV